MSKAERETLARKVRASIKRRKVRPVYHGDVMEALGYSRRHAADDTPAKQAVRRQNYLDLKDDVFELGIVFLGRAMFDLTDAGEIAADEVKVAWSKARERDERIKAAV